MKKQSLILGFLFLSSTIVAQRFQKAPETDKQVKQIIEWKTYVDPDNGQETTVKEYVFDFNKKGSLTSYKKHAPFLKYEASLHYDEQGRLKLKKDNLYLRDREEQFFYYPKIDVFYQLIDSVVIMKMVSYKNAEGQLVEEKGFIQDSDDKNELTLFSRRVLNYNKMDSLFGEMVYLYNKDGSFDRRKIIHNYDPSDKLKTSKLMFENDGSLFAQYIYHYDDEKRLTKIEKERMTTGWSSAKKYLYKEGKLWQEIFEDQRSQTKQVKIFKNGRLIREKEYEKKKLISYTDFQYLFW